MQNRAEIQARYAKSCKNQVAVCKNVQQSERGMQKDVKTKVTVCKTV